MRQREGGAGALTPERARSAEQAELIRTELREQGLTVHTWGAGEILSIQGGGDIRLWARVSGTEVSVHAYVPDPDAQPGRIGYDLLTAATLSSAQASDDAGSARKSAQALRALLEDPEPGA